MRQRVITAVVALIVFIPIIWIGGYAVEILAAVLAVIGVYELFRMKGLELASFEGSPICIRCCFSCAAKKSLVFLFTRKSR